MIKPRPAVCNPGTHVWIQDSLTQTATCKNCRLIIGPSIDTITPIEQDLDETPEEAYERAMRGIK